MSGAYSENPDAIFVNLDLIGFIEPTPSADYPPHPLLDDVAANTRHNRLTPS